MSVSAFAAFSGSTLAWVSADSTGWPPASSPSETRPSAGSDPSSAGASTVPSSAGTSAVPSPSAGASAAGASSCATSGLSASRVSPSSWACSPSSRFGSVAASSAFGASASFAAPPSSRFASPASSRGFSSAAIRPVCAPSAAAMRAVRSSTSRLIWARWSFSSFNWVFTPSSSVSASAISVFSRVISALRASASISLRSSIYAFAASSWSARVSRRACADWR